MQDKKFTKWVAAWGNATSISDREISTYAKDLTLRYPVQIFFSGSKLRFHFSNLTGTEAVKLTSVFVAKKTDGERYDAVPVLFGSSESALIPPGKEILSDEVEMSVNSGDVIEVSIYLADFTQMNSGTLVTGPLSKGKFAYGNYSAQKEFPAEKSRNTSWFYFLNTIDIFTEEKNHALICFGDSITAQSWPDWLALRAYQNGSGNVSVIRRAVCGTRILRQYDCITYAAYGLKGETRFPIETQVAGADKVIVQHGINDIIHPVGKDVNQFRPWSDMPSSADLIEGFKKFYIEHARKNGLKIYGGTLLPISGWRTYEDFREKIRCEFNDWIRTTDLLDGFVDFDRVVRDSACNEKFAEGFDSGDHLHPSEEAYKAMADCVDESFFR
ncbi:MAG: GDSL-type esterase/lipase family protein [Treponema sp.]